MRGIYSTSFKRHEIFPVHYIAPFTAYDAQHPYLLENWFSPIFSVEQTSFAMESVRDTQTMVAAMSTAAKQLKVEHKKININQIEDMQDDLSGEDHSLLPSCP